MSRMRSITAITFLGLVFFTTLLGASVASTSDEQPLILQQLEGLRNQLEGILSLEGNSVGSDGGKEREGNIAKLKAEIKALEKKLCISCLIIARYANLSDKYVNQLSATVLPGMVVMFASLVGLWIVLNGYKLLFGIMKPEQLYLEFMYVAIASILLTRVGANFVNTVYEASLAVMASASSIAFVLAEKPNLNDVYGIEIEIAPYKDLLQLVYTVEQSIRKVLDLATNLLSNVSILETGQSILNIVYAIVLVLPYFLVGVTYFSQVVISVFRLMMLAAFSPFLMMAYAFGWGRGMAQSAIRTLISSIVTLFAVTAAVAVVVYAVDITNTKLTSGRDVDLENGELIVLIMLGWMSTAFITEATGLANSITGSALSNTGVGVITAGATATAAGVLAQKSRLNPLSWGRGYSGMGEGMSGLSKMKGDAGSLYERVKSVSKGGSS